MTVMMPFSEMNREAQISAIEHLAYEALDFYGVPADNMTLVNDSNNVVYHIIDTHPHYLTEAHYSLRIHRPGLKKLAWILSEQTWLGAIRHQTALSVPEPAGSVYEGQLRGIDQPVYCTIYGWIKGESRTPSQMTLEQIRGIGRFAAQLHIFSQQYAPPEGFERPSLDYEGLFGENSPYHSTAEAAYFNDEHHDIMSSVMERVQGVMRQIGEDQDSFGLIHGDLISNNLLFDGDTVSAIDFDECGYGYYLYDLAPMLWVSRELPQYANISTALWEGYTSIRPLDDDQREHLEAFLAARHVASCRWIAGNADNPNIRGRAAEIITVRVGEMQRYLTTGNLVQN